MTDEKARDLFSAYHEATLDAGLRLSLEQKLGSSPALRADYERFAATLGRLEALRTEQIEIPFDLNERIGARLDQHLWEQKQSAPRAWFGRMRLVSLGGIAAAVLVGAALSIKYNGDASHASIVPVGGSDDSGQLSVGVKQDRLVVEYLPQTRRTVTFCMEPSTTPFAQAVVDKGMRLNQPLQNANPETDLVNIQVLDAPQDRALVAIPGTHPEKAKAGSGTLEDFARALAAKYRVPVWLNGIDDPLTQVTWDLDAPDARLAAEAALKGRFSVDRRDGNLITISR